MRPQVAQEGLMSNPFLTAAAAAGIAWLLLWRAPMLATRFGLFDVPNGRKDHAAPTPATGGLAIYLAMVAASAFAGIVDRALFSLFLAGALLLIVGVLDDRHDLRWYWRVLAQAGAAAILAYVGGVRVEHLGSLGGNAFELGAWSVPFTIVATVGVINAINMCDGADGVAGTLCLTSLLLLSAAAWYAGNTQLVIQLVPVVAAMLVFLAFNLRAPWRPRASVFLGNAGSTILGLTLAWIAYRLTQDPQHPVAPVLAPWLLAPPLVDCLVLIARRIKLGKSPFQADRDHAHHLLLEAGFSPNEVAFALASTTAVLGGLAALARLSGRSVDLVLVVAFGLLTLGHYWLTARRVRAVRALTRLRQSGPRPATGSLQPAPAPLPAPDVAIPRRPSRAPLRAVSRFSSSRPDALHQERPAARGKG
jgi:UDP-GlcNAc:undecaprenyl-phosphate GlcNAc-1-phosphate transferase